MTYLVFIVVLLIGYVLGSLSGSLLLGRRRGVDIRQLGSGNAGGTNALRTLGWRFAAGVLVIDIGKGAAAAASGVLLHQPESALAPVQWGFAATLAAAAGHCWPLFFRFRGGKGAGTLVGGLLVVWPLCVLPLLLVWLLLLSWTGYVGVSTVAAAATLAPLALMQSSGQQLLPFCLIAGGLILFTHRHNLQRLHDGVEHRFERVRIWARLAEAWRERST
jgi:glycerol-3-phosphate acyltransferase PlsY